MNDAVTYLISPFGLGDTLVLCSIKKSLEEKFGKVHFIVKELHSVVMDMYGEKNYTAVSDIKFKELINQSVKQIVPEKNKTFIAHPRYHKNYNQLYSWEQALSTGFLEMYRVFFGLDHIETISHPKYIPFLNEDTKKEFIGQDDLSNTVLVLPEANSVSSLPVDLYIKLCKYYKSLGYNVITNSKDKCFYSDFSKCIYPEIYQCIAIAFACAKVISMRSGMCDILASRGKDLTVYFPDTETFDAFSINKMFKGDDVQEVFISNSIDYFNTKESTMLCKRSKLVPKAIMARKQINNHGKANVGKKYMQIFPEKPCKLFQNHNLLNTSIAEEEKNKQKLFKELCRINIQLYKFYNANSSHVKLLVEKLESNFQLKEQLLLASKDRDEAINSLSSLKLKIKAETQEKNKLHTRLEEASRGCQVLAERVCCLGVQLQNELNNTNVLEEKMSELVQVRKVVEDDKKFLTMRLDDEIEKNITLESELIVIKQKLDVLNSFVADLTMENDEMVKLMFELVQNGRCNDFLKLHFNERYYLEKNRDVQEAVSDKIISSGFLHWIIYGYYENRKVSFCSSRSIQSLYE